MVIMTFLVMSSDLKLYDLHIQVIEDYFSRRYRYIQFTKDNIQELRLLCDKRLLYSLRSRYIALLTK